MSRRAIVPVFIPPAPTGTPISLELPEGSKFRGFSFRTEATSLIEASSGIAVKETKLVAHTETRIAEPEPGREPALDDSRTEIRTLLVLGHGEALPRRRLEYLGSATHDASGLSFFVYETDNLPEVVQ